MATTRPSRRRLPPTRPHDHFVAEGLVRHARTLAIAFAAKRWSGTQRE